MDSSASRRQQLHAIGRELTPGAMSASEALWAGAITAHLHSGARVQRDLVYGEHERHRLDLFLPPAADTGASRAVFLFVHGGGFVAGGKHRPGSHLYDNIGHWAATQGWIGVNINYRLAPTHGWPSVALDIASAIQWLCANASRLRVDAPRIVLAGHSAGAAHVASYIAGHGRQGVAPQVRGAILLSGIYDVPVMASRPSVQAYYGTDATRLTARSSLDGLAATQLPLFVTAAEEDPGGFQAQALTLLRHLHAHQGRLPAFHVVPGHNHFTQAFHIGSDDHELTDLLLAFSESCLLHPDAADTRP